MTADSSLPATQSHGAKSAAPAAGPTDQVPRGGEPPSRLLEGLNEAQARAASHGRSPLLIVAGAGTGKTTTLAHRVAWLLNEGAAPDRTLLLTFTRRAAASMLARVQQLLTQQAGSPPSKRVWSGTFHGVAARLLRQHGPAVGLERNFGILDQVDAEDLIGLHRDRLGLPKKDKSFPKKRACLTIYSRTINAQRPLDEVLAELFPWVEDEHAPRLKTLFAEYVKSKRDQQMLDYDDLLVFWRGLMQTEAGHRVRDRFDHVLVDEYQDTNILQADILRGLAPTGEGVSVVGDDAQSIYSFRAANVRNILDFPKQYPGTEIVPLERNYRSTQPILDLANAVIAESKERLEKTLWTDRTEGPHPQLVACRDEYEQADRLVARIRELREDGVDYDEQAVLFRASHHTIQLEIALTTAGIPFVKFGGLKFSEAAHVKDVLAFLRLAENGRDRIAGLRVLTMLPGIGPVTAAKQLDAIEAAEGQLSVLASGTPSSRAADHWPLLVTLLRTLQKEPPPPLDEQLRLIRRYYEPILRETYDSPQTRLADLDQLEGLAARTPDRATLLNDFALDPPQSVTEVDRPEDDEPILTLSTVHSAKGLEWKSVAIMHATDGCFPSDRASGSEAELEEERRLMYVALTRAKTHLLITYPLSFYRPGRGQDFGLLAQPSRFLRGETVEPLLQRSEDAGSSEEITPGVWDALLGQWEGDQTPPF